MTTSPKPGSRWGRAGGLAGVACGLSLLLAAGCDRETRPGQLGEPAPDFALNDGQHRVDLRALRGQVVLLNFWATWCAPCLVELPSLEAMQQQMPQVKVVAVDTEDDLANYQTFLARRPPALFTIFDAGSRSNALYGTFRFPESYLIDKKGVIRRKFISSQDWTSPEIEDMMRKLVNERAG